MQKIISTCVFFLCAGVFVLGQGTGKKPAVEGQIVYEIKGNKLSLKAQCENKSGEELELRYEFEIAQIGKGNNSVSNKQSGKKELADGELKTLSSTALSWREGSRIKAVLKIYHKNKLLDTSTLELPAEKEAEE